MFITFDKMIAQQSYRHIWKAETLEISKMSVVCGFSVPSLYQKLLASKGQSNFLICIRQVAVDSDSIGPPLKQVKNLPHLS